MSKGIFVTKQFDLPVYKLLQALRVAHGDLSQWEVLQAALVSFGRRTPVERDAAIAMIHAAPSDQPTEYPLAT